MEDEDCQPTHVEPDLFYEATPPMLSLENTLLIRSVLDLSDDDDDDDIDAPTGLEVLDAQIRELTNDEYSAEVEAMMMNARPPVYDFNRWEMEARMDEFVREWRGIFDVDEFRPLGADDFDFLFGHIHEKAIVEPWNKKQEQAIEQD
jgi:hypothetical protein